MTVGFNGRDSPAASAKAEFHARGSDSDAAGGNEATGKGKAVVVAAAAGG